MKTKKLNWKIILLIVVVVLLLWLIINSIILNFQLMSGQAFKETHNSAVVQNAQDRKFIKCDGGCSGGESGSNEVGGGDGGPSFDSSGSDSKSSGSGSGGGSINVPHVDPNTGLTTDTSSGSSGQITQQSNPTPQTPSIIGPFIQVIGTQDGSFVAGFSLGKSVGFSGRIKW